MTAVRARRAGTPAEGELRPDVAAIDGLIALNMVSVVAAVPAAVDLDRYADVVVRGLRPD